MAPAPHNPRVRYDADSNIILLQEEHCRVRAISPPTAALAQWPSPLAALPALGAHLREYWRAVASESILQYRRTFADVRGITRAIRDTAPQNAAAFLAFLGQPVWIPGRRGTPKHTTRGTLFLLDTIRFGATFAVIFGVLFLTLNYQSFGKIAVAMADPLAILHDRLPVEQAAGMLSQKAITRFSDANLAQFLPPIGPPDNRLLIPSLGLNVPIVIPPSDALLREDWERLEQDIQSALENGTIHYPGTARPGQAGNFFITGHSSYYPWSKGKYKSVFARLPALNTGDEFWIYYGGDRHRYVIQDKKEVKPTDVHVLDQPLDRRIATLMTCVPVGTTLRRLILTAQELDPLSGAPMAVGQHATTADMPKVKAGMLPI